jgi:signal transduction histidine kinase
VQLYFKTGEIVIASKEGNEAIFITPLRNDPNAAFKRRVRLGSNEAIPIQKAVQGDNGSGLSIDYREKEILAVWKYLPHLRWGMVVKIDTNEAYSNIYIFRNRILTIGFIVFVIVLIIGFRISRAISGPIKSLQKSSERIGRGELDAVIEIESKDEIGQLAESFNKMTKDLKSITASRDTLNKEIAERKRAEEKLEQAVKELVRSNYDLEQFAYIASHDLQSPLFAISGFADLLKKQYKDKLDKNAHEYIDFIVNSIERMENLINDLLTYSRIGTSSSKLNPVDVNKIFVRAIANLTVEIEKNGAKVAHDSLPTVIGNDIQLEQLLQNLIGNAIKFHSQEPPRVHISVEQKGENWVFSVKDNGIGIASEDRDRIFNMFQCLHRGEYKGTGIGLAVCKKIVGLHGGNIWVESQPGKGSIFYFTIPLTRE